MPCDNNSFDGRDGGAAAIGNLVIRHQWDQTSGKMTLVFSRDTAKNRPILRAMAARSARDCDECAIRSVSVCSVLPEHDLRIFEALGQTTNFKPRAIILAEGEPADAVYNVTSGCVRLYRLLHDGSRQIVGFGLPGDFLGVPLDGRYSFSADAADHVTACRFSRRMFSNFLDDNPQFVRQLLESATKGLDRAHDQMALLGRPKAKARVAAFLIGLRTRWARIYSASVTVSLPMGRQDIADFLGLSIATVSRTLHRLADEHLILIVPKGVRILNLERLQRLSEV